MHILVCTIENQAYGFSLEVVERNILAVQSTSLPQAPGHILGVINIHGQIVPVVNMRMLLGLPLRELDVNDHFVVCRREHTTKADKSIALWVDRVEGVRHCEQAELIAAQELMSNLHAISYALKGGSLGSAAESLSPEPSGTLKGPTLTLILDLEKLLGEKMGL